MSPALAADTNVILLFFCPYVLMSPALAANTNDISYVLLSPALAAISISGSLTAPTVTHSSHNLKHFRNTDIIPLHP